MTVATKTTRAVVIEDFDGPARLQDVPVPELGPTQVLIRVHAASLNAFDWKAAEGRFRESFEYVFPVVIGRDYAGVVEATGAEVTRVRPGDRVFGFFTGMQLHRGSFAGHVWVDAGECFVPTPANLDHATAACLPLCGIVALRCVDAIDPQPGDEVLVIGAPGGVGSYVVQLLAARGAHVIATGPEADAGYLTDLGATTLLPPGHALPDAIDGLVDLVHYREDFARHAALLRDPTRAASLHRAAEQGTNVDSRPDPALLTRLGELVASGDLSVPIEATYALEDAVAGLAALRDTHARGKRVITTQEPA